MTGRFELKNNNGVTVSIDYRDISRDYRNKIEKAAEDFFNSVSEILNNETREMHIEDDLKHFGIEKDELDSVQLFRCQNSEFFRGETGINLVIRECERLNGKAPRKARIIIDYDADFPNIITRVISR